jgi:hypothetical protein
MVEFITNRYGDMREVTQISMDKIRVSGNSEFSRTARDSDNSIIMFDFEGGPCINKGATVKFFKTKWVVESIDILDEKYQNMHSVLLTVKFSKANEKNK